MGLPVTTGVDTMVQLHGQGLEPLLLQTRRETPQQAFGAGKYAEAHFAGELPAAGSTHKDRGCGVVDGRLGGMGSFSDSTNHQSRVWVSNRSDGAIKRTMGHPSHRYLGGDSIDRSSTGDAIQVGRGA